MTDYKEKIKKCSVMSKFIVAIVLLVSLTACQKGVKLKAPETSFDDYRYDNMFLDQPSSDIKKSLEEKYEDEFRVPGVKIATLSYGESVAELIHDTKEDFTYEEYLELIESEKIQKPTFVTFFVMSEDSVKEYGLEELILLSHKIKLEDFNHYFTAMIVDKETYMGNKFTFSGDAYKYIPKLEREISENKEAFGGLIDGQWDPITSDGLEEVSLSWKGLVKELKLNED